MIKLVPIIFMLLFTSCVGVIKDNKPSSAKSDNQLSSAKFEGIYSGQGISHSKILVKFKPVSNSTNQFSYMAHLNGNPMPAITLVGSQASIDSEGYINLIIPNLEFNSPYHINIEAMDLTTKRYVPTTQSIEVWTMNSYVPEFNEVIKAENTFGIEAMTSLNIIWNLATTAEISGNDAFNPEHTVSGYNIYYSASKSELENVLELDNQHFPDISNYTQTKIVSIADGSITAYTITNLTPGREYYVAVRARQSSSPPKYELNNRILSNKTYLTQPVEFAGINTASVPKDIRGFSQIETSWVACTGCGQYKIYAKPEQLDSGSINPISDVNYLIDTILSPSTTSKNISDGTKILPNTTYKVYVIACKDSNCGWNGSTFNNAEIQGRFISRSVTTTPPIARFSESTPSSIISSIVQPTGTLGLEQLDITWSEVDTTSGYYSEVRIYHVLDITGNVFEIKDNPNIVEVTPFVAQPFGTPFIHSSTGSLYSSNSPTSAKIANLQRDQEYCFLVLPWITGNGLSESQEITLPYNLWPTIKCATPQYIPPVFGDSSLLPECDQRDNGTAINLSWTHPDVLNIFSLYEIFYRDSNAPFAFTGTNGAWG